MQSKLIFILEWENSCKAFTKAKAVVEKEGVPSFFIKYLAELEDFVQNVSIYVYNFLVSNFVHEAG